MPRMIRSHQPLIAGLRERHGIRRDGVGEHSLEDLYRRITLLENQLRAGLSFGVPVSITELGAASGQRAGNMRGAWARTSVTALGQNTFNHNLELATPTGLVNVRWPIVCFQHDGTAAGAGDTISVNYQGGTIAANSIQLYVTASGSRTVDGSHPITIDIFFIPADG